LLIVLYAANSCDMAHGVIKFSILCSLSHFKRLRLVVILKFYVYVFYKSIIIKELVHT